MSEGNITSSALTPAGDADHCMHRTAVTLIVLVSILCIFGLVGNILTRLTLWPDRTKSATVFLLICLGFMDDLVLITHGFLFLCGGLSYELASFKFCKQMKPVWVLANIVHMADAWLIVIVSVFRYMSVCNPAMAARFNTIKAASCCLSSVILGCVFFNLPHFLSPKCGWRREGDGLNTTRSTATTSTTETTPLDSSCIQDSIKSYKIGYGIVSLILMYVIPLVILLYTTEQLLVSLRQLKKRHSQMVTIRKKSPATRLRREMSRSIVGVVVLFCVCQLANHISRILRHVKTVNHNLKTCKTFLHFFALVFCRVLVVFNSAVNFVIFCACGSGFRQKLKERLGYRPKGLSDNEHVHDVVHSSYQ